MSRVVDASRVVSSYLAGVAIVSSLCSATIQTMRTRLQQIDRVSAGRGLGK